MPRSTTPRAHEARRDESGFTVLEVVVAIAIVTIVMTSLAAFFVNSGKLTDYQSQRQTAAQGAETAMDKARSLSGIGAVHNRDKASSDALWTAGQNATSTTKYPGVAAYLTNVGEAYDATAGSNAGATAPLPTTGNPITLGGMTYTQNWFLGYCLRQSDGTCKAGSDPSANNTYLQVIVDVTWTNRSCANSLCSYVTAGQISQTPDPVFGKPTIAPIDAQTNETGSVVSLAATASGGTGPYVWSATGLPPGITISGTSTTGTMTGKPTTTGTYSVVVEVADANGDTDNQAFTWIITAGPSIATIANQTKETTSTVSLAATASGGTSPYVWSATGLPPGITISSTTGTMSGTPTTTGTYSAVVKVTDSVSATSSRSVTWTITAGPSIATINNQTNETTSTVSLAATASGGTSPYAWSATGLPPGITISSTTGTMSGTPTTTGTYSAVVKVTDSVSATSSRSVTWTITAGPTIATIANRSGHTGTAVSFTASVTGGTSAYTWSATGLPTGIGITRTGSTVTISGTPFHAGTYSVAVTATDSVGAGDRKTFTWTVT